MVNLSLGQLTAIEAEPAEFIAIAAAAGAQSVSLMVNSPNPQSPFPEVTQDNFSAVQQALRDSGLRVNNVECFMLTPHSNVESFREAFAIGQQLGAIGATALVYDSDEEQVKTNLRQLCALGKEYNLRINLEFMAMTPKWNTLTSAAELIQQVGVDNLGLGVDLLHFVRSGSTLEDLACIPEEIIYYAQLCDSLDITANQDYAVEASAQRLAPGAGKFAVREFIQALPSHAFLELEVPQSAAVPAGERVKAIVAATRATLAG